MTDFQFWLGIYFKILGAYLLLMWIWPEIVFRKFLKEKDKTFRFGFNTLSSIVIINTVVLVLGLFHLLYKWTFFAFFYGSLAWGLYHMWHPGEKFMEKWRRLSSGTYGFKSFRQNIRFAIANAFKTVINSVKVFFAGNVISYFLLIAIVIFGTLYYSWGVFTNYSYGASDLYPHSNWLYNLMNGKIFSAGVYPEGMHCYMYAICTLLNLELYNVMQMMGAVNIILFILSIYILFKEAFVWKYSPHILLILFLSFGTPRLDFIASLSRLQFSLPQEFAFPACFLCAAFMLRFLKSKKEKWSVLDDNLINFSLAIAVMVVIHFYPLIMAVFLCIGFVTFWIIQLFPIKKFMSIAAVAVLGVVIGFLPMAGALASGIPFQGSIGWALGVMEGSRSDDSVQLNTDEVERDGYITFEEVLEAKGRLAKDFTYDSDSTVLEESYRFIYSDGTSEIVTDIPDNAQPEIDRLLKEAELMLSKGSGNPITYLKFVFKIFATDDLEKAFVDEVRIAILCAMLLAMGIWIVYLFIALILYCIPKTRKYVNFTKYNTYPGIVFSAFIFTIMLAPKAVGLIQLIQAYRLGVLVLIFGLSCLVIPIDFVFSLLGRHLAILQGMLGVTAVVATYVLIRQYGYFHSFLYGEITRYNIGVMLTESIIEDVPENSFTLVSTTDDIYQVALSGYHEELTDFVNKSKVNNSKGYYIPTEYVFVLVEKKPFYAYQRNYYSGPSWLAYENNYVAASNTSLSNAYAAGDTGSEYVIGENASVSTSVKTYTNMETRKAVYSTVLDWVDKFDGVYPGELKTYYEDENVVCYYFRQNYKSPYNLAFR